MSKRVEALTFEIRYPTIPVFETSERRRKKKRV